MVTLGEGKQGDRKREREREEKRGDRERERERAIRGRGMGEKEMGGEKWEGVIKGERERKKKFGFVECVGGWASLCSILAYVYYM